MKKVFYAFSLTPCLCHVYTRVLAVPPNTIRTELPSSNALYLFPRATKLKEGRK